MKVLFYKILIPYKNNPNKCEDVILGYNKFEDCKISPSYFNSITINIILKTS